MFFWSKHTVSTSGKLNIDPAVKTLAGTVDFPASNCSIYRFAVFQRMKCESWSKSLLAERRDTALTHTNTGNESWDGETGSVPAQLE